MSNWFTRHKSMLDKALDACEKRYSWTAFSESPSSKIHGVELPAAGKARFEALLGKDYPLHQAGNNGWVGAEISP